jgi:hypothetical protein
MGWGPRENRDLKNSSPASYRIQSTHSCLHNNEWFKTPPPTKVVQKTENEGRPTRDSHSESGRCEKMDGTYTVNADKMFRVEYPQNFR